jgi:uncharacterized integral membrane protein (TIGR00697 family)
MEKTNYKLLEWFTVVFVVMLLISNIIAGKIVSIGGMIIPAAVFLFPFTYIFGDIITEVYGYEADRKRIWMGFFSNLLMIVTFMFIVALPYPAFWKNQDAFATVLGQVPRIVAASLVSYWVGSFLNSYIMSKMKIWLRTFDKNDKLLFIRTIGSTLAGEGADTVMFIFLAFIGTMPVETVFTLMLTQFCFKVGIEIVMTPATYFIVAKVKKIENEDVIGAETYNPMKLV